MFSRHSRRFPFPASPHRGSLAFCCLAGMSTGELIVSRSQSTINTIVGASALLAVSDKNQLPEPAGIVIIALITLVIALFGYKYVHAIERYASIPVFIIFLIMLGEGGRHMQGGFGNLGEGQPSAILSFGGTIAGFALGWTSLAADYTVNLPAETANWKVFVCTYIGLNFPLIFVESLGALMMSTFEAKPSWGERYDTGGLGGLLAAGLSPLGGFGKFLLVLLALSIVTNVSRLFRLSRNARWMPCRSGGCCGERPGRLPDSGFDALLTHFRSTTEHSQCLLLRLDGPVVPQVAPAHPAFLALHPLHHHLFVATSFRSSHRLRRTDVLLLHYRHCPRRGRLRQLRDGLRHPPRHPLL